MSATWKRKLAPAATSALHSRISFFFFFTHDGAKSTDEIFKAIEAFVASVRQSDQYAPTFSCIYLEQLKPPRENKECQFLRSFGHFPCPLEEIVKLRVNKKLPVREMV